MRKSENLRGRPDGCKNRRWQDARADGKQIVAAADQHQKEIADSSPLPHSTQHQLFAGALSTGAGNFIFYESTVRLAPVTPSRVEHERKIVPRRRFQKGSLQVKSGRRYGVFEWMSCNRMEHSSGNYAGNRLDLSVSSQSVRPGSSFSPISTP